MHPTGIRILGLTGGIGSGKSTAARRLVALGATLVDTDAIAHALTAPGGAAMPALKARFGDDVADASGALDRARMRSLVFADPEAKRTLEGILHPMIGTEAQRQADAAGPDGVVVFDVPLMVGASVWRARCQRILVIDCAVETQVQRVMARNGWPEAQVRAVIAQQATREARRAIADAVIHNDGLSPEQLAGEVDALWAAWIGPVPAADAR